MSMHWNIFDKLRQNKSIITKSVRIVIVHNKYTENDIT